MKIMKCTEYMLTPIVWYKPSYTTSPWKGLISGSLYEACLFGTGFCWDNNPNSQPISGKTPKRFTLRFILDAFHDFERVRKIIHERQPK